MINKKKELGRLLVATRDLEVDDLILTEAPLVLGPKQETEPICLGCYRRVSGKYRCSRCTWPLCGPKCEVSPDHQPECDVTKAAGVTISIDDTDGGPHHLYEVITALRCLVFAGREPKRWRTCAERFNTRYLQQGAGWPQHRHNQELVVNVLRDRFRLHQYPGVDGSEAAIHTVLGLLQINQVPTKTSYSEVQALYPMASLASHSCMPNTKPVWKDGKLTLRASDPIKRGEAITFIYTDILWGTRARRDHLRQTRLLTCSCQRCADPTELNTYFSALLCRRCGNNVLPTSPLDDYDPWTCESCSSQISVEEVLRTNLALGAAVEVALAKPSIPSLEALQQEWTPRVHTNHYHLHAVKHSLLQLYGRSKEKASDQEKDAAHWIEIAKKEKSCKEFLTVCSRLDPSTAQTIPFVGLTFYEYHKTILQSAQKHFAQNKLTTQQLKKRMLLSKALLKKAMEIFKHEEEDTPEGQLYVTCEQEVIRIGKWMLAVGLV
ncbi:SET domain-containing protein SmydA-8-like 3 [Homarus americanus]|uniref:SET domain-containing protein SmydA-8-like 3 n=1 Tax=Homarus americanus TaxID=6706 RepID=A0A8J5N8J0_HOMAM|nr:SET domain-containing protein SmydA-8-like 3 [Homarus americanus]